MYAEAAVQGHDICPFCKEVFPEGEHTECPSCEVHLISAEKYAAITQAEVPEEEEEPLLPWGHWGHARGPLLLVSVLGLVCFFLPWIHQFTPDRVVFTGLDLAQRTRFSWATAVAWFVLIPTIFSRRTLSKLRGVRLAAALLAFIPALVALIFLLNPPDALQVRGLSLRIRFEWGMGLYLTLVLGIFSPPFAMLRLGKLGVQCGGIRVALRNKNQEQWSCNRRLCSNLCLHNL